MIEQLVIAIVITAVVIGVPFYAGSRAAVKKAIAKHKTVQGKVIAGIEAITEYVKDHPVQDGKLLTMIEDIAQLAQEIK